MIEIRRRMVVRRDVWFDEPWAEDGADLVVFYHWSGAVNPAAALEVHSLEIDLRQPIAEIWKGVAPTARNLIQRAEKEGISVQMWANPGKETIDEFFEAHRRFAQERGLNSEDPIWMQTYCAQNALLLTRASTADGKPLVWHSYSKGKDWARLLHSISIEGDPSQRKAIGWANRYLHWMDLLECQKQGIQRFDFGGWYSGTTDEKLLRINAFKEQFGGVKTRRYHSMLATSTVGRLYLKFRERLKGRRDLVHFV
jgi:hypothetical protein